jgi:hypothetical protein
MIKKVAATVVLAAGSALLVKGVLALMSRNASATGTIDTWAPIGLGGALVCLILGIRLLMPPKPF